jgi:peptide/nickel transport system substrate-binding protein
MSVTWRLKTGVQWHDGQPFSADDVVFNWEYASDPATAATTIGSYQDMEIEKIDSFTVRVHFAKPTPFWAGRANGLIIPKHLFEPYKGANSRETPANLNRWGPALIGSSTSSPAIWSKASAIPTTTCPTGRISTRSS